MADGMFSAAARALAAPRSVVLGGVALLATVTLLNIGSQNGRDASPMSVASVAHAQSAAAPASDPSGKFTPDQVKALHAIIKDYLLTNPEVLAEVSQALERKQAAEQQAKAEKFLADNKAKVFTTGTDVVIGNPKGDVTVVEFFDYNCGWCKRAVDDLTKLTKADPRVRVVLKEYPIFGGPQSVLAAKAALASVKQGKYWEFHTALMREKQVTEANLFTVAQKVGLDVNKLKADMADKKLDSVIEQNIQVGQGLGIEGTPGFVIDSKVNVGYVPADGIQQMLAEIRKSGCKMC
jgi:protein-disulfide isomerase